MKATTIVIITLILLVLGNLKTNAQGCAPPKSDDGVSVFGFLQPQFETDFLKDGPEYSFSFNRARIGVTGNVPYDVMYYAVIEASAFKTGNPFLLDAFVSYTRFDFARFSIGQFKSPFTFEMATPCHELNTIYRSMAVTNLVSPDRDLGIMISGNVWDKLFSYSVAVTNGTGIGGYDNNNAKTFHSRLVLAPINLVKVGGGVQYGKHPSIVENSTEQDQRFRWSSDIQLKYKSFDVIGEYIYGSDKGSYTVGGGCGGDVTVLEGDLRRSGYYITAMYRTKWNIQPVVRYENWNTDLDTKNRAEHIVTAGINFWPNDWSRIQINYLYKSEERLEIMNDQLVIQFQVVF